MLLFITLAFFILSSAISAQNPDPLQKYTISAPGINATFIPYGARLTNLYVNDKNGAPQDVVLGYDDVADYVRDDRTVHTFFGPVVGRYANRIKNGTFTVQGVTSHIPQNDNMGHDTLHGGNIGYDQRNWTVVSANSTSVTFSLLDQGFEGFPGNVMTFATYSVSSNPPRWTSRLVSIPLDEPIPIMLANHVYWNLGAFVDPAGSTILNHTLHMPYADRYIEIDHIEVPTGALGAVRGNNNTSSYLDFTSPKQIGRDIESAINGCGYNCTGYDNAFILDRPRYSGPESRDLSMLTLSSNATGIRMDIYTNQQSLQIYTCDNQNGTIPVKQSQQHASGNETTYVQKYGCVVIETQQWIDGINHPEWGQDQYQIYTVDSEPAVYLLPDLPIAWRNCTTEVSDTLLTMRDPLPFRPAASSAGADESINSPIYDCYYNNSTAPHIDTNVVLTSALRKEYPILHLTITSTYSSNLLAFAAAGHASAHPASTTESDPHDSFPYPNSLPTDLKWRRYIPPATRVSPNPGVLIDSVKFGRYIYTWQEDEYILYNIVGAHNLYDEEVSYILGPSASANDALLLAACSYWNELHDEILVFNNGYWSKNHKLWEEVQKSSWDDVILGEEMKRGIKGEMEKFFGGEERYKRLKVPWKRGVIYYGPPGNGKTISIKAMMHTLSLYQPNPIPTLYVRSLSSYGGPEYSIQSIFRQARSQAPCLLVFEDLDSLVTDDVRSYFLNEVDGLESNDGILMVGSTNHLERLDPGIRKRPSRFDRKFFFGLPDMSERTMYCEFWRKKLSADNNENDDDDDNSYNTEILETEPTIEIDYRQAGEGDPEIPFPHILCKAIASITAGFSFAYIQEAFVATLLSIAANEEENEYDV
ncbi:MAG: hypothetical protein Q9168_007601, partial [Polycauliona sp. 1 TL-2023]